MARFPLNYHRVLPLLRSELQKHQGGFAPRRVLRLRLYTYYAVLRDIVGLWIELNRVLNTARDRGDLVEMGGWFVCPEDVNAFTTPSTNPTVLRKRQVLLDWDVAAQAHGKWFERVLRAGFTSAKYAVADTVIRYDFEGEPLEVDVQVMRAAPFLCESKNRLSNVYMSPKIPKKHDPDMKTIDRLFRFAHQVGAVPILFAPFVDASFHSYAIEHGGLFCQTLFQFFPASEASLVQRIKAEFRYGNVRATDTLPQHLLKWMQDIPAKLAKRANLRGTS